MAATAQREAHTRLVITFHVFRFFPRAGTSCLYYYSGATLRPPLLSSLSLSLSFLRGTRLSSRMVAWYHRAPSRHLRRRLPPHRCRAAELSAKDDEDDFLRFVSRAGTTEI